MSTSFAYSLFKEKIISILGGFCIECGSNKSLEIDHIDPLTKSFNISKSWSTRSKEEVLKELEKCQLLCTDCHKTKSKKDLSFLLSKDRTKCHGTLSQYYTYKCRCEKCRECCSRFRRKLKGNPNGSYIRGPYKKAVCGSSSQYKKGCRCRLCKDAHNVKMKEYNKKRKIC